MIVSIAELQIEDAPLLAEFANNYKIWSNLRDTFPHPYLLDNALDFIHYINSQLPLQKMAIKVDGVFAGIIGLELKSDIFRKSAEIGYWVAEPHWGKGIATIALNQFIEYAFTVFDLKRLEAGVFSENHSSAKVLLNCGFEPFGYAQKAIYKADQYFDLHLFELINREHNVLSF